MNNAGIEEGLPYDQLSVESIDHVLEVNLNAPMVLTRLLLPGMIARGRGHIVNIASLSGLLGTAYNETYSASKHGLMGFTRSLRITAQGEGWPVSASAVCPGFVADAGMYENVRAVHGVRAPKLLGTSPPEKVAAEVIRAVVDDVPEIVVNPGPTRPLLALGTLFPRFPGWFAEKSGVVALFQKTARDRAGERKG